MHNTKKNRRYWKKRIKELSELGNAHRKNIKSNLLNTLGEENQILVPKASIKTLKKFLGNKDFSLKTSLKGPAKSKFNVVKIPRIFSFSENPDETIKILRQVSSSMFREKPHTISINFNKCEIMDLAACCVLSSILLDADEYFNKKQIYIEAKGVNISSRVGQMLVISGLVEHLGLAKGEQEEKLKDNKILMPLLTDKGESQPVEQIMKYLNDCFDAEGIGLTDHGNQMMGDIIGEVFSNIDDHNKEFKRWYALGHAEIYEELTMVNLAIMNYGASFPESFIQNDTENFARHQIESLYRKQKDKHPSLDKNLYVTLLCLQKYISRYKSSDESTRGQGLVELLDNFIKIGQYDKENNISVMSITTGNISIKFDGEEVIDNKGRVYLGVRHDYLKSKEKFFKKLNNNFPGTVISMKFVINREFLEGAIRKNENSN